MFMVVGLGARFGDRYALTDCVGVGGMGEVWSAHDEVLDRMVAVKVLAGPLADDPVLRASILQEAKAAARLVHPHVTQVFDFGEQSAGAGAVMPYLVMELVEGANLHDRLRSGALPWPEAVEVAADIADALAAAHRIGLVHLDIKPSNVMLTPAGAKVLDFGVAALAGRPPLPGSGLRAGTPTYSAPERFYDNRADPVADVFSLGVLLYECLVGHPPWQVDSWADVAVARKVRAARVDVPELPAEVAAIVGRCLHTDPAKRPSSAQVALVLAAAAGRAPRGQAAVPRAPVAAARPSPTMYDPGPADAGVLPADRPVRPDRLGLVGIVGVVAALVVVALLISSSLSGGEPTAVGGTAVPNAVTSSQSGAPDPSAHPTPANTNPAASLAAVQSSVEAGVAAGDIDADAGNELLATVQQLRKRLEQGKPAKVAEVAGDLLKRIGEWAQDGRVTPQRAAELRTLLQPVATGQQSDG